MIKMIRMLIVLAVVLMDCFVIDLVPYKALDKDLSVSVI